LSVQKNRLDPRKNSNLEVELERGKETEPSSTARGAQQKNILFREGGRGKLKGNDPGKKKKSDREKKTQGNGPAGRGLPNSIAITIMGRTKNTQERKPSKKAKRVKATPHQPTLPRLEIPGGGRKVEVGKKGWGG